jgi:co-chaperonin GroES (HSP10)
MRLFFCPQINSRRLSMILQPRENRVLVKRDLIRMKGLLYMPPNSREMKFNAGEIVAAGPDARDDLQPGDMIMFGQYAPLNMDPRELKEVGIEIPPDTEYLIMNDADIFCHIVDDAEEAKEAANG